MRASQWLAVVGISAVLMAGPLGAAETAAVKRDAFGTLQSPAVETARDQARDWLKATGNMNQGAFDAIWSEERPLLDRVADTLALGHPDAGKLLAGARDSAGSPPKATPALLQDAKLPAFFRANLSLAYAKALSNRRNFEEALDALKTVKAEQVVDPAAFFFHKAVAEHALLQKEPATRSIVRLLDDVADAPDRYKLVATLMFFDMQGWKEKDLAEISRKMNVISWRLDQSKGGPKTQKIQKEVVLRLDEIIKEMENQKKQQQASASDPNGGGCPSGAQPGAQPGNTNQPSSPQQDSVGGTNTGPGKIDEKTLKQYADVWGKLPEKERAKAMMELTRDMPPRYKEVIETYFKKLAQSAQP